MTRIKRFKARSKEALPPPPPVKTASSEAVSETDSTAVNWTKLALGDDSNSLEGSVSPYQIDSNSPQTASETGSDSRVAESHDDDSPDSEPTGSGSDAAELGVTEPGATESVEGEAGEGEFSKGDTEESSDAPTEGSLADSKNAQKAEKRAEKAAKKAAAREATKVRKAEIEKEYDSLPEARRVKLTISRVNPLSAMKIGFLVAVAFALIQFVAAGVLWIVLDMLHVFSSMQGFLAALSATALVSLMDALQFSRFIALVALYGVFQILVFTVLAWLAAVIYNLIARMVGGLHLVLTDD